VGFDWISFTTDYGRSDGFAAACHGVIARIAPSVRIIDITHDVPPQDVRHGAAVLAQTVGFLPRSVHIAIVDPGVGTARRAVAVETPAGTLVGPDNGLLLWAADVLGGVQAAVALQNPAFRLSTGAHTFDGRDIFAPVAAHLARGIPLIEFGPAFDPAELIRLPEPRRQVLDGIIETEVLLIDRFGNLQLAARSDDVTAAGLGTRVRLAVSGHATPIRLGSTFADVAAGELVLYEDSAGHLSVAVNGGNAAQRLTAQPGDPVSLTS
jgi:S-adenosyl-L-methionine hydrolase (adenosine-forming)